jgi:putative peptide zinc metalloprotease protein
MPTPTTSSQWYRVAQLHPRLRGHVTVQRQVYRQEVWYLLSDGLRGRTHRLNRAAYAFIGRCDGNRTVQAVWDNLLDSHPDEVPTQDEVIALLVQLNHRGLLQCEQTPDVEQLFRSEMRERRQNRLQSMNPLSFRVALFDPSAILKRFDRLTPSIFSGSALLVWSLLMVAGLLATASNWNALQGHAATWLATPQGFFLMWLAFPVIKAIHELAHGLAVRRWGGEVHRAGVTLLVLTPVPFVDASTASTFRKASNRFAVSAAGMMAELAFAALAILLWTQIQPGMIRDLALTVAIIGSVSSLAFNANPLLRFDGYYMLTDAIHLPNLQTRSALYWRYLLLRHALRLKETPAPETAPGEKRWLIAYAPLSWAYRLALSLLIATWVGGWSAPLGLLILAFSAWTLIVTPLHNFLNSLRRAGARSEDQRRARVALTAWAFALVVLLGFIPLPFATVAQGVVWAPDNALLRPATGGFAAAFKVRDGATVAPGDLIAVLADPALQVEAERIRSEIIQRETELYRLMLSDTVAAANLSEHLGRLAGERARINERIGQLELRAAVGGRLAMPRQNDIEGSYLAQGKVIGHIITNEPATIRVAVDQNGAARVQSATRAISVRLAEAPAEAHDARLKSSIPGASNRLPSAALADHSAGPHVADPGDGERLTTREPLFLFDVALPLAQGERIGGRAWVRFEHPPTPLAVQWLGRLQQLFLNTFNPGA